MQYYNNYGYNPTNLGQLQSQLQQLQQLQSQYYPQQNQQAQRGTFIQVKDYQEVINYPTDASGMPTLFMNETQGVFWVKKFIDGTNKIQAYNFAPINDFSNNTINNTSQEEKRLESNKNDDLIENLQTRITKLEDTNEEILKLLKEKKG